jgi:hypothetical protein
MIKAERYSLPTHIGETEKRFVVRADEKLTAFIELESAVRAFKSIGARKRNAKFCEASSKEVNFHSWPYTEKGRP